MLQEKTNLIEIVGLLSEVAIEERQKDPENINSKYLTGTVTIKTEIEIDGQMTEVDIPINVFANKITTKGNSNPVYESLMNVKNNMTSIAACGNKEEATCVRVYQEKGSLRENSFYGSQGNLVQGLRVTAGFFNQVPRTKYENTARFETIVFILDIIEETDREGIETGRLLIKSAVPGYNGVINNINYVVQNKRAIEHINSFWKKGDTVKVFGKFNFTTKIDTVTEEVGFGESVEKKVSRSQKELLITAGSPTALDDEDSFEANEIIAGLEKRKAELEAKKNEANKKPAQKKLDAAALGF